MIPPRTTDQLTPSLPLARQVLADTTYDSDALYSQIAETGAVAVIPPRPNRLQPPHLNLLAPLLAPARQVLADTAYDSDALRAQIAETGAVAVIPPRPNRLQPPHLDLLAYRNRNQVERLINRLKQFRHTTHYDKLADSYAAFVQLRAIILWLN